MGKDILQSDRQARQGCWAGFGCLKKQGRVLESYREILETFLLCFEKCSFSFATLLEKDRSVTIPEKNMQLLMTEMFKTINYLNPSFMNEIFLQRNALYNLRNTSLFLVLKVHTVNYGIETVRHRGQRMWHSLPQEFKDAGSVQKFNSTF